MAEKPPGAIRSRGGRPLYVPSAGTRRTVEQLRFAGWSEAAIARTLAVDVDTLRRHLRDELENGHARQQRELIEGLFQRAEAGNVAAIIRLEAMGRAACSAETVSSPPMRKAPPDRSGRACSEAGEFRPRG